jgi:hypothetical protein
MAGARGWTCAALVIAATLSCARASADDGPGALRLGLGVDLSDGITGAIPAPPADATTAPPPRDPIAEPASDLAPATAPSGQ